mmetsp:Transcript_2772/g.7768  ORF Transcript_2772/g.7768 Transcript_2772/m.7768 type:complete len:282 (-) Transcript_2772:296-1141(-)
MVRHLLCRDARLVPDAVLVQQPRLGEGSAGRGGWHSVVCRCGWWRRADERARSSAGHLASGRQDGPRQARAAVDRPGGLLRAGGRAEVPVGVVRQRLQWSAGRQPLVFHQRQGLWPRCRRGGGADQEVRHSCPRRGCYRHRTPCRRLHAADGAVRQQDHRLRAQPGGLPDPPSERQAEPGPEYRRAQHRHCRRRRHHRVPVRGPLQRRRGRLRHWWQEAHLPSSQPRAVLDSHVWSGDHSVDRLHQDGRGGLRPSAGHRHGLADHDDLPRWEVSDAAGGVG